MKILLYSIAAIASLFGLLSLFRGIEILVTGGGFQVVQFIVAAAGLVLAWLWVKRARAVKKS